jgi:hypothetical protein
MIIAQWSCEVPDETFDDFIQWVEDTLKPYYESQGCVNYSFFLPVKKKYFPYQETQSKNRYTEQFTFNDLEDYERFLLEHEENSKAKEITSAYRGRFKVHSCKMQVYNQII